MENSEDKALKERRIDRGKEGKEKAGRMKGDVSVERKNEKMEARKRR